MAILTIAALIILSLVNSATAQTLIVLKSNENQSLAKIFETVDSVNTECWLGTLNERTAYELEIQLLEKDTFFYIKSATFLKHSALRPSHQFDYKNIRFLIRFLPSYSVYSDSLVLKFFKYTGEVDDWYFKNLTYQAAFPNDNDKDLRTTKVIIDAILSQNRLLKIEIVKNCNR